VKRKKWTRPDKPWSTADLVSLHIPIDAEQRKEFAQFYQQKTGYALEESMPLEHALELITGAHKPGRALEIAVHYLMFGVPAFPHQDEEALRSGEIQIIIRRFTLEEALQYLAQFESGLTAWRFVQLANSLAAAKAASRRQASAKNLERTKGGETEIA
jgi:hypothetical protein